MNWAERETGNGRQKIGKGRRGRREEQMGEVFMVVRESGARARAFPDRAAAKPGESNRTTEITQ
jgi:hypothetical protein